MCMSHCYTLTAYNMHYFCDPVSSTTIAAPPPPHSALCNKVLNISVSVCLCLCLSLSVCLSLCLCVSVSLSVSVCLSVSLSLSFSLSLSLSFSLSLPTVLDIVRSFLPFKTLWFPVACDFFFFIFVPVIEASSLVQPVHINFVLMCMLCVCMYVSYDMFISIKTE